MRKITLFAAAIALACVSAPPALSTFPPRAGAAWSEECCGEPLVMPEPEYPGDHVPSGQGGWVIVSGILDERGWVTDPVVLAAEPEGMFDAAALQAFDGWRYAAPPDREKRREVRAVLTFHAPRATPAPPASSGGGGTSGGGGPGY
jgi:TonB family protein